MSVIDKDEAVRRIAGIARIARSDSQKALLGRCMYIIEHCPTVDAEPVRHGMWELVIANIYNPYESEIEEKCSNCGRCVQRYGTQAQDNYCPNCGAKMGGSVECDPQHTE